MLTAALLATTDGVRWIESLIGFVIWLLILVWIYNIAKRKGRHPIGWQMCIRDSQSTGL